MKTSFVPFGICVLLAALSLSVCTTCPGQTTYPRKLDIEFTAIEGDVSDYQFSPDGNRVVYRAGQDTAGVPELYSVASTGGVPVKLSGTLVAGGAVFACQISADGTRVVYWANQDAVGRVELYSVPIAGGDPVKLNSTSVIGAGVLDYLVSPDGSHVVYRAEQDRAGVIELYGVPIEGGTVARLNGAFADTADVAEGYAITADGKRVVYVADQDTDDVFELYGVPIGGGVPEKLNETGTFRSCSKSVRTAAAWSIVPMRRPTTSTSFSAYRWRGASW